MGRLKHTLNMKISHMIPIEQGSMGPSGTILLSKKKMNHLSRKVSSKVVSDKRNSPFEVG